MRKLTAALMTTGIFLSAATMVGADTLATITETGAQSTNIIKVKQECDSVVDQKNKSVITNSVHVYSNTGGNQANWNTGDGSVTTGSISTGVGITNGGNTNVAGGNECCLCAHGTTEAAIVGTGWDSFNKVKITESNTSVVEQRNYTRRTNEVWVKNKTGKNKANGNTGNGTVETGGAETGVEIVNEGDHNVHGGLFPL